MQVQIRIDQKEAIKRGLDAPHSTIKLDINPAELTQAERDWIADNLYDGYRLDYHGSLSAKAPNMEGFREGLQWEIQRPAREAAEKSVRDQQALQDYISTLTQRKTRQAHSVVFARGRAANVGWDAAYCDVDESSPLVQQAIDAVPGAREWLADLSRKYELAKAEAEAEARRREAACDAENKAEADAEAAAEAFKADWIREHGTDNQRGRLDAGMLPDEEIINTITDAAFARVKAEPYIKPTAADVECTCEYPDPEGCRVEFSAGDEFAATAEQWEALVALRNQLPEGAAVKLRWHKSEREACEQVTWRHSLRASVNVGPLTVTREFAVK